MKRILGGRGRAFRVGEVEGTGHRLYTDGVIVHIQRCESGRVGALICHPPGGRLDCVEDL